jgi:diguanylate cyclase (GGDEF)-like protein/PAS domain S-box-containing protein
MPEPNMDLTRRRGTVSLAKQSAGSMARRYRALLEHLPQTAIVVFNRELRLELVTGPALGDAGIDAGELQGRLLTEILPPTAAQALIPHYRRALTGEEVSLEYQSTINGRAFWLSIVPLRDELGEIEGGMAVTLDVTDRAHAQSALRRSEERFRRAFDEAPIGMALITPDGRLRKVNHALCEILGREPGELVDEYLATLIVSEERGDHQETMRRLLDGETDNHRGELRLIHASGHAVATALHAALVRDSNGDPEHLLLQIQDNTDRKHFEDQLHFMADHDPLTGLLNRRGFERELTSHVGRVQRYGAHGALLAMDLDHFKVINDSRGHHAGDELIIRVAGLLRERLRESDVLARLGGDEFAVLLPYATSEQATALAAVLLDQVRAAEIDLSGARPTQITTSIGVTMFEDDGATGEEMLIRADVAMYEAKAGGRDRASIYDTDGGAIPHARASLSWVEQIRAAINEDRLCLHAQPIVALDAVQPSMYEMLLRMIGENGELIPPDAFLGVAERFDLIAGIDRWVVRRAILLLERAHADGRACTLSINVSAKSLGDTGLLTHIEELLHDHAVAPENLMFEVTETAVIANMQSARHFARRLRELGCRVALDDFGSGFGSFLYLKHLPFDLLKIDGEFVTNCLLNRTDRLLIEAVVTIAQGLDKLTVAEFTPNQQTLEFLQRSGVDFSQGYFTGPPVPVEQTTFAAALIRAGTERP